MEDKIKKDLEDILHFNSDSDTEIEEFRNGEINCPHHPKWVIPQNVPF